MADFTKQAIRTSFLKLLNEKPLKQISVKDIVDDCGINRNTFYYHFQDIPQLLDSIVKTDTDRIIREHPSLDSLEDCLEAAISFSLENRRAVLHIYRSVNRDIFEQYQWHVCKYTVTTYLDGLLQGRTISESDRNYLIHYAECVMFGVVMGWLDSGLPDDIHAFIHRICELKLGDLEEFINRCAEN